ncbi:MAG TPA: UGSC family (seleno)protein [Candidatus Acidoferrales bacterium]|nr:UGSC family (seleno)protein [Candidatus Acidoferrales bacterium]
MGFPTAPMVTIAFKDLAKSNAASRGMPHERICFTPHPVWGKTDAEMYGYLQGNDPVSGKPLMKEVVDALTQPLTADETKTGQVEVSTGPATFSDTAENLRQYYIDNGMTDFMEIVLPTEERVQEMLKGTSHKPDELVGKMSPARGSYPEWTYNVRHVAINAVMAGAKPEYLPTILAIAESGLTSLSSSTNSFATAAVINGPIRDKLNMNYGIGAMGPFAQPNAAIGRAWTLLSRNLSNSGIPGQTYLGTLGNGVNYNNLIIPENEKDSPWTPLHVQRGFKAEENVVSVFVGFSISQGQGGVGLGVKPVPHYHEAIAYNCTPFGPLFGALIVCDPLVAQGLVELGYKTKEQLADWLQKNTLISAKNARTTLFGGRWVPNPQTPDDTMIPYYQRPESFNFVVVGGQTNPYHMVANMSLRASISIDKWA